MITFWKKKESRESALKLFKVNGYIGVRTLNFSKEKNGK